MPITRVLPVDPDRPDPNVIAEAARVIRSGGLVAFATETVYGLGADATNPEAVARIFEAKGRPSANPLIVHVADQEDAKTCVADWPARAEILAGRFWPGPLTLVLPRAAIIPDLVTASQDTVGVRVPHLNVARWLILESGRPIAAPSANRSMGISPTLARHVLADLDRRVDLILDSGPTRVGIESTVLDLSREPLRILRPGEVTREAIAEVLDEPVWQREEWPDPEGPHRSPGQMAIHYAPRTPAYRLERDQVAIHTVEGEFNVLVVGALLDPWPFATSLPVGDLTEPEAASASLYGRLHDLDASGIDFLLIVPPPDEPRWRAVRDRIWRATRPWPPGSG